MVVTSNGDIASAKRANLILVHRIFIIYPHILRHTETDIRAHRHTRQMKTYDHAPASEKYVRSSHGADLDPRHHFASTYSASFGGHELKHRAYHPLAASIALGDERQVVASGGAVGKQATAFTKDLAFSPALLLARYVAGVELETGGYRSCPCLILHVCGISYARAFRNMFYHPRAAWCSPICSILDAGT